MHSAYEHLKETMLLMKQIQDYTNFQLYLGFVSSLETCLSLISLKFEGNDKEYNKIGSELISRFKKHASIYPIGKCSLLYWKGNMYWSKNNKKRAFKNWRNCLQLAEKVDMPFEQALSLYALGKFDTANHEMSVNYLDQAIKIFKKSNALHQLEAVKRKKREKHKLTGALSFVTLATKKKKNNLEVSYNSN